MSETISEQKRQEWLATIKAEPELFLAMAEQTPAGRKILEEIRQHSGNDQQRAKEQAQLVNDTDAYISQREAYEALAALDTSNFRESMQVAGLPLSEMVTLIEYARQQATLNNPDLYVLQDSREHPDNQMLFWAKNAQGYTTNIDKAHRFTQREAEAQQKTRETDIPHRVGDLAPATDKMLDQASRSLAKLEREIREAKDPLVIPRPRGVNLAIDGSLNNFGEHAGATYDLKPLFQRDQAHSDDQVILAALRESPDTLETVLINPDQHQVDSLARNPDILFRTTTLAEFAASLWCHPNAHRAMPYNSWEQLTEFVRPHLKDIHDTQARVPAQMAKDLPTDLPPALAAERLHILDSLPSPENLKVKLALADIEMASLYGEPSTEHLFTDTQMLQSWHDELRNTSLDTLYSKAADLEFMHQELTDEIRQQIREGHSVSNDERYTLAMLKQQQSEIERKIDSVNSASYRASMKNSEALHVPDPHDTDEDEGPRLN